MSSRKKMTRFSGSDDLRLLREVLAENPYQNKGKWSEIAESLSLANFQIDSRRARERTQLLLNQFNKDTNNNLKK